MEASTHRPRLWNSNYLKVWTANFMLFFSFYLIAPLLPIYMSETFHADKQMIGLVLSGYTLTALMVRPFSGFFVDSFPRKQVLLTCYFLFFIFFAGYLVAGTLLLFAVVRTLHGAPFGATTVSNSTVAIDVLHPERRAEGIGYYGLSNNIATALGPTVGLYIYDLTSNFDIIFALSLLASGIGLVINTTTRLSRREPVKESRKLSLDRFLLLKGWSEGVVIASLSFSFGVLSTYIAIYGKQELGITSGTSTFFMLLAIGLILSRIVGGRSLSRGRIVENASGGMALSLLGYMLFASVSDLWAYYSSALIIGLGNGHMFPAMQTMFINLAPNSQRGTANSTLLTSWDVGMGAGVLAGGAMAEACGYHPAFWLAVAVNAFGVAFFFIYTRRHFLRNRLR